MNFLVFTDLDGTLLDYDTYSWKEAEKSLEFLKKESIPVIPITSKTKSETIIFIEKIGLNNIVFSVENGGAVYFPLNFKEYLDDCMENDDLCKIEIGTPVNDVLDYLRKIADKWEVKIKTIFDCSKKDLKEILNLTEEMALKAKEREYDIPFKIETEEEIKVKKFLEEIKKSEFKIVKGGRFFHISSKYDKGIAAKIILNVYKRIFFENVRTIGLGDSENDLPLLKSVDIPVLIRKKSGKYCNKITNEIKDIYLTKNPAPSGWNEIFEKLFFI